MEEKKTPIVIDDKEYLYEEMNEQQQTCVFHIHDLEKKMKQHTLEYDQLRAARSTFVSMLKQELTKEK